MSDTSGHRGEKSERKFRCMEKTTFSTRCQAPFGKHRFASKNRVAPGARHPVQAVLMPAKNCPSARCQAPWGYGGDC